MSRPSAGIAPAPRAGLRLLAAGALLAASAFLPGCYTTQLGLLRSGLDSLRAQVDTLTVRDSVTARVLAETRRELGAQRDLMLSSRATSGSTMQEMFDQMGRLEGKLDDVMHRFGDWAARTSSGQANGPPTVNVAPPGAGESAAAANPAAAGPPPAQLYDQATRDLTEGRYPLALQGYRDFLVRFPNAELAASAQYGVAECFFAQAAFDSAAVEYQRVPARWPKGDRTPAALYKLGLCQDRLGRAADSRKTFEDLVRRFPTSSEAALARDRLGATHH